MADLDKVISALDCLAHGGGAYDCLKFPCPYGFYGYTDCHKWEIARDALELIKEQKEHQQIIRCKDCKHRGNKKKCIVAFVADKQDFPFFFYDNHGEWFCADGEKKDDTES